MNHWLLLAAVTNHLLLCWHLLSSLFVCFFSVFILIFRFPMFFVIMTSHCFNFRFAYPLPLLPYLLTTRMASGHPTDKFSFMYQPDTHKRYGTRMHTLSHSHVRPPPPTPRVHFLKDQVSSNNRGTEASTLRGSRKQKKHCRCKENGTVSSFFARLPGW